jgi:hypothetical protein
MGITVSWPLQTFHHFQTRAGIPSLKHRLAFQRRRADWLAEISGAKAASER